MTHTQEQFKGNTDRRKYHNMRSAQRRLDEAMYYLECEDQQSFEFYYRQYLAHLSKHHVSGEQGDLLSEVKAH